MELAQHQGERLRYLTVHPDGYDPASAYPMVILLHGFGASMEDLAGLSPAIDRHGYVYVFPNAPVEIDIGMGMVGYSWTAPNKFSDPEEGQRAKALVDAFVAEVMARHGGEAGRVVLGGFSQGAGLSYRSGLERPDLFTGLVILSGAVADVDQLATHLPSERTQPLFIAHGLYDPMVPIDRARQAREFLESAGYQPEYHEYPIGHEVSQELINDLAPWLRRILPPAGRG